MTPRERAQAIVYALLDAEDNDLAGIIVGHIDAAVKEEREACAVVATNAYEQKEDAGTDCCSDTAYGIAAAIRAQKPHKVR